MKSFGYVWILFFFFFHCHTAIANKHALLIAIEDYRNTHLQSLEGPGNDIKIIKHVLESRYGFKDQNIIVLRNDAATHTGIERAFSILENRIHSDDFVYIHYSGHGSLTPDLNGDEDSGFDQTWVPYGSRVQGNTGKDSYDILDDELNTWIARLIVKSENVVFVSDSCHSASVTRGKAPAIRGGAVDRREHPLGRHKFEHTKFKAGIRVGASRDHEPAAEFRAEDGNEYGLFTWFWTKALQQAWVGETWSDLYQHSFTMVTTRRPTQEPQIEGRVDLGVFGEGDAKALNKSAHIKRIRNRVTVSQILGDGKKARIEAGFISNVTVDSVYTLYDPSEKNNILPKITITNVNPFYSIGNITGDIKVGDLLVEKEHAYDLDKIRIFISAEDPKGEDEKAIQQVRSIFNKPELQGYEITENQNNCILVLYVVRPEKQNGKYIVDKAKTLPKSVKGKPPEIWILSDVEQLLSDNLRIPFVDYNKGKKTLVENLRKIARIREIKRLVSTNPPEFEIVTTIWHSVNHCDKGDDCLVLLLDGHTYFEISKRYDQDQMHQLWREKVQFQPNSLFTFSLKNNSKHPFYAYIINLMNDGEVKPVFPTIHHCREQALLKPGKNKNLRLDTALLLKEPGEELIKLIVTEKPINIALLQQEAFKRREGSLNPLERLLANAVHGKRSSTVNMRVDQWGTTQFSFWVGR
jgi:hypothetical protein